MAQNGDNQKKHALANAQERKGFASFDLKGFFNGACGGNFIKRIPLWVRLSNLHLQYWFDCYFEVVGNYLDNFFMVDEGSLNFLQTTYARLLVEIDITRELPLEILIKNSKGCWLQPLDLEGILFRCRRCFKMGLIICLCDKCKVEKSITWWKEVTPLHYIVEKVDENHKNIPQVLSEEDECLNVGSEKEMKDMESSNTSECLEINRKNSGDVGTLAIDNVMVGSCVDKVGKDKC
ncbi:hypothetical protein SUGI_0005010 [Cryptomeria japonica]|nr:hypothetical protein SUGI_0005010 [Cryptomeria japonica]